MSAELEFTNKIRYAEEWLNKAKKEFSDGSTITAASHIILAIAEMETLKRALFSNEPAISEVKPVKRSRRIDLRPIIAAALFLIAAGIFAFSSSKALPKPDIQPVINDTHFNTIIGNLDNQEAFTSPVPESFTIPDISQTGPAMTAPASASNIAKKTSGYHSKQTGRIASVSKGSNSDKPATLSETIPPAITNFTPPAWNLASAASELNPKLISLETIIAARESLNEK